MKTTKNNLIGIGVMAAIALAAWLPTTLKAADEMKPMKGGEHLQMLGKVATKADADALKPGDTFAMVCAKCKTVWVTRVVQGAKGAQILNEHGKPTELVGTHACNGCSSTITVVGQGKGKEAVLKHTCNTCGDDSAFCCATKAGGTKK
jgi:formate-dependent nitrite reductase cytochrome c552 subunit